MSLKSWSWLQPMNEAYGMKIYLRILIYLFITTLFVGCLNYENHESLSDNNESYNNNINNQKLNNLNLKEKTVVLEFYTDWCGYCKALEPTMNQLEKEGVEIIKINTDEYPEMARQFGIRGLPTVIYIKDGKVVGRTIGYDPEEITKKAKELYN